MNRLTPIILAAITWPAFAIGLPPADPDPNGIVIQEVPEKTVALSFDDGVASHATIVAPILKQHGFGGSFYICDFDSFNTRKDWYLTWAQIQSLSADGFDVGNHTKGHGGASSGPWLAMEDEFSLNHVPKPTTLAWPVYAVYPTLYASLISSKYTFGRAGGDRPYRPTVDHPLNVPSFSLSDSVSMDTFMGEAQRATRGRIVVFTIHGVPEGEHPSVSLDPVKFARMMQYFKDNNYNVISMSALGNYVDVAKAGSLLPAAAVTADITLSDTATIASSNTFTSTNVTCNVTVAGAQKTFGGTGSGRVLVSGAITGSASLALAAPYVLELRPGSGTNALTGISVADSTLRGTAAGLNSSPLALSNATLQLEDTSNAWSFFPSPLTLTGVNTIQALDNHRTTLSGKLSGSGSVTYSGYYALSRYNSDSDSSGPTRLAQEEWYRQSADDSQGIEDFMFGVGGSKPFGTGVVTIAGTGGTRMGIAYGASGTQVIPNNMVLETPLAFSWSNTNSIDLAGTISGTGSLVKVFAAGDTGSTLHLRGANSYSGGTRFFSGNLNFYQANSFGTGTVTLGGKASTSHALCLRNQAALTVANAFVLVGITDTTVNGGSPTFAGARGTTLNNAAAQAEINTAGGNLTLSGPLSGSGGLLKSGTNTLTLSGINSYAGATKVAAGTLAGSSSAALGGGPLDITSGATVALNFTGTRAVAGLSFNGGSLQGAGTYGSTSSTATNKSTYFSGTGTLTVLPITSTTLALTGGSSPAALGAALTFTATVTGSAPTGNVTFYAAGKLLGTTAYYTGATAIGTSAVNGSSQASLTTSGLTTGFYDITACYGGDAANQPNTSAALTVKVGDPEVAEDFLTFVFTGQAGSTISGSRISVTVPYTTDVTALAPTYSVSTGATASPASGSARNFTSPQTYTVTGQDGTTKTYTVTVNRTPVSSAKDVLTFVFPGQAASTLSGTNIGVNVPMGTTVTALAPTFTLSPYATCVPGSGTVRDFTSAQTYTVTAQDGSTQAYSVTVTKTGLPTTFTWSSTAAGNWNDASKWTNNLASGTAPATAGQADYTLNFNLSGTYTATNDLPAGFLLNQINCGGSTATLAGNSLVFASNTSNGSLPRLNQNSSSGVAISAPLGLASGLTIGGTGSGALNLSGIISGTGSLTTNITGQLTLSGVNTYSGGTTINAGNVVIYNNNSTLGTGPVTVNSGANLALDRNSMINALTLNGGSVSGSNGFGESWTGPITLAAVSTMNCGNSMSWSNTVSGSGGLIKTGNGTMTLSGTNTYSGPTSVNGGTLVFAKAVSLYNGDSARWIPANIIVPVNQTLRLKVGGSGEFSGAQVGTLLDNLTSGVSNNGLQAGSIIGLDTANATATVAVSAVIKDSVGTGGGAFSLRKYGSNTLQLAAANTYSGQTTIDGGTLSVASLNSVAGGVSSSNLGAPTTPEKGTIVFGTSAGLTYTGSGETTDRVMDFAGAASTLTFTQAGTGLLKFTSGFAVSGFGSNKTLVLTGSSSGSGEIAGSIINPYGNGVQTTSLTKSGSGSWTLSGSNSYTGPTTVTAGTLACSSAGSLGSKALSISSGAKVALNFPGTCPISALTLNGAAQAAGTYGSTASTATTKNDSYFSGTGTVTVGPVGAAATITSLALAAGNFTTTVGTALTFTATVTGTTPTGNVTFYAGTTALGTAALNGSYQASLTTGSLAAGSYDITAQYAGDANDQPGNSAAMAIRVNSTATQSAKSILSCVFPGLPTTTIVGSQIRLNVPPGTNVAALAPTYTVSPGATGDPVSGSIRNFITPQTYLITAADLSTQTYTVTVNTVPLATPQSASTAEDTAKILTLTASDAEGNPLNYAIVTPPAHGSLSGTAPNVTYTPASNYYGADSFTFKVNDGIVDSAVATVSLTVTPVNDAPVANAQSVSTMQDTAKAITLSATDVDGDSLAYVIVTQPAHGSLTGSAPNVIYTPAAGFRGADSFTFKANDGTIDSAPATVSLTVTAVNHAPVAAAQSVSTAEDTALAITLTATDVDLDALTYALVTAPTHGTLSGSAPNVTYTPASNYYGTDSFTFTANDGQTDSAAATVSLTVTAVNDAPVANAQSLTTAQDTAKAITLSATDVEGSSLAYAIVTQPAHGSLTGNAPNLTYTPAAGYIGSDGFTFKANDGALDSAVATVSLIVTSATPSIRIKAATGTDLSGAASWGGSTPGFIDTASWTATSLGAGLALGSPTSWDNISVAAALTDIGISGAGPLTLTSGIDMSASTVNLALGSPVVLGASQTWNVNAAKTLTASGVISGSGFGLTKTGTGTLTLNSAAVNAFTGGLSVNGGTAMLDQLAVPTDLVPSANVLTLGGGTLSLKGKGSAVTSQSFASTTLSANRGSVITLTQNSATSLTAALGTLTRNPGSTLNFTAVPATSGIIATTTSVNTYGILGPWASVGTSTAMQYAANNGSGKIISYAGATPASAADLSNATDPVVNYSFAAAATQTGNLTANTLRYTGGAATLANGGFKTTLNGLMHAGSGTLTISGTGNLEIGVNRELVIFGGAQQITIASLMVDNGLGASSLVYHNLSASKQLYLSSINNTYSGGTTVNGGDLHCQPNTAGTGVKMLGTGTVIINNGTLSSNNGSITHANSMVFNDATVSAGDYDVNFSGPVTLLGNNTFIPNKYNNPWIALQNTVGGTGGFTLSPSSVNCMVKFGATATYTGNTIITSGIVQLGANG
ncbi:MAG: Ig-like domain-containing protein, partial [Verrucomicrobiota bacterium]